MAEIIGWVVIALFALSMWDLVDVHVDIHDHVPGTKTVCSRQAG